MHFKDNGEPGIVLLHNRRGHLNEEAKSQFWIIVTLSVILAILVAIQQDNMPLTDMSAATIQQLEQTDWARAENFEIFAAPLVNAH